MCDDDVTVSDLGPCCICEGRVDVVNIVMLSRRAAVPGCGWGCLVCGLPRDGAYAVLCDRCLPLWQEHPEALVMACVGYPGEGNRIPIAKLPEGEFDHDMSKHKDDLSHV